MIRDLSMGDFISRRSLVALRRAGFKHPECERLVFYKWRYVLMADGFTGVQARRLAFMRWLQLRKVPSAGGAA